MTQTELLEIVEKHEKWLLGANDGQRAYLRYADLSGANLRVANLSHTTLYDADLRGANLFNTVLPLWCGGTEIKMDRLQMAQLAYHFCTMECDDSEVIELQKSLYAFANEFVESHGNLKRFPEIAAQ